MRVELVVYITDEGDAIVISVELENSNTGDEDSDNGGQVVMLSAVIMGSIM